MLDFVQYINEADKSRFVKKNPNLTKAQKLIVIDWLKTHRQAEKKLLRANNNDPNIFSQWQWQSFVNIMSSDTKSSLKKKAKALRHKGISGLKENEDYIHMKIKNKYFLVYIPLHYEASKIIMSVHIGDCHHEGCIGASQAKTYYRLEAVDTGKIPIIVIGNGEKYAVMMHEDNRSWDIWYKSNSPGDVRHDEGIPNFEIKKELVGSKQSKLYDEIRNDVWPEKQGKDEAIDAYEKLAWDIEHWVEQYHVAKEDGYQAIIKNIKKTIDYYREVAKDTMKEYEKWERKQKYDLPPEEIDRRKAMIDRIEAIKLMIKKVPEGTDQDKDGNPIWYISGIESDQRTRRRNVYGSTINDETGVAYTKDELIRYIDFAEKNFKKDIPKSKKVDQAFLDDERQSALNSVEEYNEYADKLEDFLKNDKDNFHMIYSENRYGDRDYKWLDQVDFADYIPSHEEEWVSDADVYDPYLESDQYKAYSDWNERFGSGERLEGSNLEESIREIPYYSDSVDGQEFLEDNNFPHPNEM
jgi:hypothetical protein